MAVSFVRAFVALNCLICLVVVECNPVEPSMSAQPSKQVVSDTYAKDHTLNPDYYYYYEYCKYLQFLKRFIENS